MSSRNRRKERKRQRKAKATQKGRAAQERRHAAIERFPPIIYQEGVAPAEFVAVVKDAMTKIVDGHQEFMPEAMREAFYRAKIEGFSSVIRDVQVAVNEVEGTPYGTNYLAFMTVLGSKLYASLPKLDLQRNVPYHNISVWYGRTNDGLVDDHAVIVKFDSLCRIETNDGPAYHSPLRPTVTIDGVRGVLSYSKHAIEKLRKRTVGGWRRYHAAGDAFAYIYGGAYLTPWVNQDGRPVGVSLFDDCALGFASSRYAEELIGDYDPAARYCYRIGYCPLEFCNGAWVATTLLLPGMKGTPEFERCLKPKLDNGEDETEIRRRVEGLYYDKLMRSGDFSLLREFQDSGVIQVELASTLGISPKAEMAEYHALAVKAAAKKEKAALIEEQFTREQKEAVAAADVIVVREKSTGARIRLCGEELLRRIAATGNTEQARVIEFEVESFDDDLDELRSVIDKLRLGSP